MKEAPVTRAQFEKFERRTYNEILRALPGLVKDQEKRVKHYVDREIGRRLSEDRTALYKYVDKELARLLSTPKLKETVRRLIEQEFGRQDPNAINVEVIEKFGAGDKAKKNKNPAEFE